MVKVRQFYIFFTVMCGGSIEVDVWRARIGLFAGHLISRLPKRWKKIKRELASMVFMHCLLVSNFRHKAETNTRSAVMVLVSLVLAVSVANMSLILRSGDVELNPGPGRFPDLDYDSVDDSRILVEADLNAVMAEIVMVKARYYSFGRALGLPAGELEAVRLANNQNPEQGLNDVTLAWLQQKYNIVKHGPPTWRRLVEAVDDAAGGDNHKLARTIGSQHLIVSESDDGSTAKQYEVMDKLDTPIDYIAKLIVVSGSGYAGCGRGRGRGRGRGQGSCTMNTHSHRVGGVKSDKGDMCRLTQQGNEYREVLVGFYLRQVDDHAWPPVKVTNFINLALIKNQTSWRETVQESVDEVIGEKASIAYMDIFDGIGQHKFILMEGRPGSGKTTLMTKISRDWANGEIIASELFFLIQLRRLNPIKNRDLAALLEVACPSFDKDEIAGLSFLLQSVKGKGAVFALDGLDEYLQSSSNDIIFELIKGRFLRNSVVVVTSRPAASQQFRDQAGKRIEVLGFLKPQIIQYIHDYFESNTKNAQLLITHLERRPNLMNMCYLPLHSAMLVFLYEEDTILPETETEFYKHFTLSTLLRSFRKRKDHGNSTPFFLTTFDQLPSNDKILFDNVCKLAFEATVESKQVFKLSELKDISFESGSTGNDESSLGLVVIDRYFMRYGLDETYTFLHLTFQEYLAAVYIAGLSQPEQQDIIKKHCVSNQLRVVWKFLCGMLDYSHEYAKDVFKFLISNIVGTGMYTDLEGRDDRSLLLVECTYESQNRQLCEYLITTTWNGIMEVTGNVTPYNASAIGYLMSEPQLQQAVMEECSMDNESAAAIFREVDNSSLSLEIIHGSYEEILKAAKNCNIGCVSYSLGSRSFSISGAKDFAEVLKTSPKLHKINFHMNLYVPGVPSIIMDGLKYCTALLELNLSENNLSEDDARTLSEILKVHTKLKDLNLRGNSFGDTGAKVFAEGLKHCAELQKLDLSNNNISSDGVLALSKSCMHCTKLTHLNLGGNKLDDSALSTIFENLKICALEWLSFADSSLTDEALSDFTEIVTVVKTLQVLEIWNNDFSEFGKSILKEVGVERDSETLLEIIDEKNP